MSEFSCLDVLSGFGGIVIVVVILEGCTVFFTMWFILWVACTEFIE